MSREPVYLTSDVHLGAIPPENERAFLRWLEHAGAHASRIVVNGDLFDFWFEYRSVVPRGHARVLGALARLVDADVPVHLVGGNHDWWGGSFLSDEIGVEFHRDPTVLELADRKTLLAHGDGVGGGEMGYRILKRILRARVTRWAFRWLHPDVGSSLARLVSQTGDRAAEPSPTPDDRSKALQSWARETLVDDPSLDLVVLGHTHRPTLEEVRPDRYYVNTGDWLHNRSYVVLSPGSEPCLARWEG